MTGLGAISPDGKWLALPESGKYPGSAKLWRLSKQDHSRLTIALVFVAAVAVLLVLGERAVGGDPALLSQWIAPAVSAACDRLSRNST